jgi:hypothetical protein
MSNSISRWDDMWAVTFQSLLTSELLGISENSEFLKIRGENKKADAAYEIGM